MTLGWAHQPAVSVGSLGGLLRALRSLALLLTCPLTDRLSDSPSARQLEIEGIHLDYDF